VALSLLGWGTLIPPDGVELVVHHDPAPGNLVRRPSGWALVDWDAAGPGSRLWDLAYAVQTGVPLRADRAVSESLAPLRALVDGYGLDDAEREELVELLPRRAEAMVTMLHTARQEDRFRDGATAPATPSSPGRALRRPAVRRRPR
jgi:thiamine kinase-like enzyme